MKYVLFILLAALAVPAAAAGAYAVELVVFERTGGEAPPGGELLPAVAQARDPGPPSATPVPYARLADADLALTAQARRLTASGRYRVLAHAGWWQPAGASTQAMRVDTLGSGLALGEALTGTVRLTETQVLRVVADLAVVREAGIGDGGVQRLHARRGVRPGEVNYLDHPTLGALVQVRPAP